MSGWAKGVVRWREQNRLCLSIPFTWLLKDARALCLSLPNEQIVVGGPAVRLMPEFLAHIPNVEVETITPDNPLRRANPDATRTTFGCPNACPFCGVRAIEGPYRELQTWWLAPTICDSNFLACSQGHFDRVIDRLKIADFPAVDFNQGLEARLLTAKRARRLTEIRLRPRFAWDGPRDEGPLWRAVGSLEQYGFSCRSSSPESSSTAPCHVYVLVGYEETLDEATYRLETLRAARLCGVAMRYQPLNTLTKNAYCPPQWNRKVLADFCRYWNRQAWLGGITFEEYRAGQRPKHQEVLL